jgi:hypothetical protein
MRRILEFHAVPQDLALIPDIGRVMNDIYPFFDDFGALHLLPPFVR